MAKLTQQGQRQSDRSRVLKNLRVVNMAASFRSPFFRHNCSRSPRQRLGVYSLDSTSLTARASVAVPADISSRNVSEEQRHPSGCHFAFSLGDDSPPSCCSAEAEAKSGLSSLAAIFGHAIKSTRSSSILRVSMVDFTHHRRKGSGKIKISFKFSYPRMVLKHH